MTMPEAQRGCVDSFKVTVPHAVEVAKVVIAEHKLPLILVGHSMGGATAMMASAMIAQECKQASVPLVCALYLCAWDVW